MKNDGVCKSQKLLTYFEETNSKRCGICSSCLERSKKSEISEKDSKLILNLLKTDTLSSRKLEVLTTFNRYKLTTILTNLLEKELIEITERNTYKLKMA